MLPHLNKLKYEIDSAQLTTVALCISKLSSDEILHPERVADTAPCERVTLAVTRAVQLTD